VRLIHELSSLDPRMFSDYFKRAGLQV